jgi:hypothetical protein
MIGDEVAVDNDVWIKVVTDMASGGAETLLTPILGTTAANPGSRVRPKVTDGGGGKAGDDDSDIGEGAEQATLSSCGKRMTVEEADGYRAGSATSRVGESFETQLPETFYEDFTRILKACEINEEEETSGDAATLHASILGTTVSGFSAPDRCMIRMVTAKVLD